MNVDREQMLKLAGIEYNFNQAYTPATIGKKNLSVAPRNVWGDQFRNLNFTNLNELKAIQPNTVSMKQCYFQSENGEYAPITKRYAVVDDVTQDCYAIHSNRYEPIQHNVIVNAMVDACYDTDLSVFGHFDTDSKGRFNGYGTFANPDFHINLGVEHGFDDPIMLGMRFFNSHNGDNRFGGTIYGIRAVCQNYMAWGDILGEVSFLHFKSEIDVTQELSNILKSFVDKIDVLKDKVHYIRETEVSIDDVENILWGIGFKPEYIENILTYKEELNPEYAGSLWDVYNSTTAYVTYKVGGNHTVNMNLDLSNKIQKILTEKTDDLMNVGERNKIKYYEELDRKASRQVQKVRLELAQ